jgi:hypothetical protein
LLRGLPALETYKINKVSCPEVVAAP